MKLARKLTLAILAVMVAVLALNAAERIARDRRVFREDTERDHRALGRALQAVVRESSREGGEARALALVEAANQHENAVQIRWIWLDGRLPVLALTLEERAALEQNHHVTRVDARADGEWLSTYVPARLADGRLGAIRFTESLASEAELVRGTVTRTVLSTALIGGLAALVTSMLGVWMVGRPVAQLIGKARRVGAGDLSGPIVLHHRDELADLAAEMNAMCDRLDAAAHAREQALDQLRHAERLGTVGRLAAGVGHELGTPLHVIALESKRIAVGRATGSEAIEGAQVIGAQAERMTVIIRQLLDFAGRRARRTSDVELGAVARETIGLLGTLALRQQVRLAHRASEAAEVRADTSQLQQVITNLVVNAIQATPPNGEVWVETGRSDERELPAYVRVVDHGSGIAADVLPRIFEPFFTTKDIGQGTGLGLAVVHGIIEEHGGRIDVESQIGRGAVFTVRLPNREAT